MKVTVTFQSNLEDDGVDCQTVFSQNNVEDLSQLSWVFAEAARAGGYTYVDSVTFFTDQGKEFKADF